jgi:hypothetical protein
MPRVARRALQVGRSEERAAKAHLRLVENRALAEPGPGGESDELAWPGACDQPFERPLLGGRKW